MLNIWKKFESLLPSPKQLIGKITYNDTGRKTCTIELLSGTTIHVMGNGTVNSYYLIVNGELSREMQTDGTIFEEIIY
jgi:hypothetical protein